MVRRLPRSNPIAAKAIGFLFLTAALFMIPAIAAAFEIPAVAVTGAISFALPNPGNTVYTTSSMMRVENKGRSTPPSLIDNEGQVPQDVAAGDFNRDGRTDLAIAFAFDDMVRWYFGEDDGAFYFGGEVEVGLKEGDENDLPRKLLAHDFDADGFTDLAVLCSGNPDYLHYSESSLGILYGIPSGGFEKYRVVEMAPDSEPVPEFSLVLEMGLVDGDDRMDLVVGHFESRQISVILHQGRRMWKTSLLHCVSTEGSGPAAIAVEDLDFDGVTDLAIANYEDIQVWKGDGEGGFPLRARFTQGSVWTSVVTADFDWDGQWDLALLDGEENKLFLAMGFVKFSEEDPEDDGSGDDDVVEGDLDDYFKRTFEIDLKQNLIDLKPGEPTEVEGPVDLVRYDANQDGLDDLSIVYHTSGGGDLYLGTREGAADSPPLRFSRHFPTAWSPRSIIAADLTGDGWDDLAFVHEGDRYEDRNDDLMLNVNPANALGLTTPVLQDPVLSDLDLPSYLERPRGLTWDPEREVLWTIDRQARELVALSKSGETSHTFSFSEARVSFLLDPADLAVDDKGVLWITDRLASFVYRARPDGTPDGGMTGFPTEEAGLLHPSGIAYDPDRKLFYVSDERLPLIAAFSLEGELEKVFEIDERHTALDLAWAEAPNSAENDPILWATLANQNPDAPVDDGQAGGEWRLLVLSLDGDSGRAVPEGGIRGGAMGAVPPWAMLRSVALEYGMEANHQERADAWLLTDSGTLIRSRVGGENPPTEGQLTTYSVQQVRELSILREIRSAAFQEERMLLADAGIMATVVQVGTTGAVLSETTLNRSSYPSLSIEGLSCKNGKIYVLDGRNEEIRVFASDGAPLGAFGQQSLKGLRPRGLYVDPAYPYFFVGAPGRLIVLNEEGIVLTGYTIPASFPPESVSGGEKAGEVLLYSPSRRTLIFHRHRYADLPAHQGSSAPTWDTLVPDLSSWSRFSPNAVALRESTGDFVLVGSGDRTVLTTRRAVPFASVGSSWQYYR